MQVDRKITVILNAGAGSGCNDESTQSLAAKFAAHGLQATVTLAKSGDDLRRLAQQAVQGGASIVAAGGGDGTLNAVASALVGRDVIFGVLPMGTLNHFAKDMKIPLQLEEAVATIAAGHAVRVDTGEVNGRCFLNNSSLGLYPETVRNRELQQNRLGRSKWPAFFWAALTVLKRNPFLHLTLTADRFSRKQRTPFVFIGNNAYIMEGFSIGALRSLTEGQLSLYFAHRTSRSGLVALAVRALLGRLRQAKDFEILSAATVNIESRHKHLRVAMDGEVTMMATPLAYRIAPESLQVFVPAAAAGGNQG
jgi:diacylglycerol kinase family enzyme